MTLEVRPIIQADYADWQRLWSSYLTFYETTLSQDIYQTTFERLLADDPNEFFGLLALWDEKPVGLAHCLSHRHCWRTENVIYLQDLFVNSNVRGKGIGRALIETVYSKADLANTPSVYWLTKADNTTARHLYDSVAREVGFVRYTR